MGRTGAVSEGRGKGQLRGALTRPVCLRFFATLHNLPPMRRLDRRLLGVLVLFLTLPVFPRLTQEADAGTRYRTRTRWVAPGLYFSRILDTRGPNRIRVLTINPAKRLTIDPVLGGGSRFARARTSAMAARRNALAAINATWGTPEGRPSGVFAADGDLKTSPMYWGRAFAISRDEKDVYFGHPELSIGATELDSGNAWPIQLWNEGAPQKWQVAGYTTAGGNLYQPPSNACGARLSRISPLMWGPEQVGVQGDYQVDQVSCGVAVERLGGIVVAAPIGGRYAPTIGALVPGETVRLGWSVGWRGVLDLVPGNPTLIENGVNVGYTCDAPLCARNPRTAVARTATGKILFVTVDGRQPGYSVGMTFPQLARFLKWRLGAVWALNLDGGGSTTMVVQDRVVNRPSDPAGERPVTSALLVLPGRDRQEVEPLPPSPLPTPTVSPTG